MKWLLVVTWFYVLPNGDLDKVQVDYRVYASEEACNRVGNNYRDVFPIPAKMKSISVCIPQSAYDE